MIAAAILALCGAMVVALFLQGLCHTRTERLLARTEQQWRPWFNRIHFEDLPPMQVPLDVIGGGHVTQMWLEVLLRIDPGSRHRVLAWAREAGLHLFVERTLRRPWRHSPTVLEACATLAGLIQLQSTTRALKSLMCSPPPAVAFSAALALMRLNPTMAKEVWKRAPTLTWGRAALLTLLKEIPADQVDEFVAGLIQQRPPKAAAQLLTAWAQLPGRGAARYATELLKNPETEGWLLCAALRMQDDVTQSPHLTQYLNHPRWAVRLLALRAIAKVGYGNDVLSLEKFQDSDDWWMRLRAREALTGLMAEAD